MSEKMTPNRYKKEADRPVSFTGHRLYPEFLKASKLGILVGILSLVAIYAHDLVVQSPFFTIQQVTISGENRVKKEDVMALAGLDEPANIFRVNLFTMEKRIASHPWVASASVHRRSLFSALTITIVEHHPLAIVRIGKMPDILINTQGAPFKAYDPEQDHGFSLPVITGLDLTHTDSHYHFEGPLFDAVLNLLHGQNTDSIISINGDDQLGITIRIPDTFNPDPVMRNLSMPIRLGFGNYSGKLITARQITQYITANIPGKVICAINLFNIDTVFVKTTDMDALPTNIEKGV